MNETKALIAVLAEEAAAEDVGAHLETWEILDYHAGDLDPETEQRLVDHLVSCRQCAVQLLDFDTLATRDPPSEGEGADFEVLASWRKLWRRVEWQRRKAWFSSPRFAAAAAAVCMVIMSGLMTANLKLRERLASLTAPQPNPPMIRFDPRTYRGEGQGAIVELPSEAEFFFLHILLLDRSFAEYEVEISRLDGKEAARIGGIGDDGGLISVSLYRRAFPASEYSLRLYGSDGEQRKLQREYRFEIRDAN